jgi:flagellin-like hook-associated protein FlgL
MTEVTLTAALRSNLLSLQNTQSLLDQTQQRLATGKKVNSALDNAGAFFAAQSVTNRASDLSNRLDGIGQAIQTIKAADNGIKAITSSLNQLRAIAQEALDQANASGGAPQDQTSLAASFTTLRTQLDSYANDAGYRGTNLLGGGDLTVTFNEDGTDTLAITGVDFTAAADLAIAVPTFADAASATAAITEIDAALELVRAQARTFGTNLTTLQTRETFTKEIINTLKEGADKLTLADQNEEAAKLLSLQTAQQLGVTSLSLASQAQQGVLRLF